MVSTFYQPPVSFLARFSISYFGCGNIIIIPVILGFPELYLPLNPEPSPPLEPPLPSGGVKIPPFLPPPEPPPEPDPVLLVLPPPELPEPPPPIFVVREPDPFDLPPENALPLAFFSTSINFFSISILAPAFERSFLN